MFYCNDDEKPRANLAPPRASREASRARHSFFSQNCAVPSSGSSSYDLNPNFA